MNDPINPIATTLCRAWLLAGIFGFVAVPQAAAQHVCRPAVAITNAKLSEWQLPAMERKWTAVVSVDASRCAANSAGYFEVRFQRLIENGADFEFSEKFAWMTPSVKIGVDFWANEAVRRAWITDVSSCRCASTAMQDR